jgi:hypothetical protein
VNDEVQQVPADEDDVDEVWNRLTDEPDIRGVEAARIDHLGGWLVEVGVQEFFRRDPLGIELRQRMAGALESVGGVTSVAEHGNESWFVTGTPSGEELTRAAANVLDDLADRLRAGMEGG